MSIFAGTNKMTLNHIKLLSTCIYDPWVWHYIPHFRNCPCINQEKLIIENFKALVLHLLELSCARTGTGMINNIAVIW